MDAKGLDFVGRQQELALIQRATHQDALTILVINGVGGIGKTALLQVLDRELLGILIPPIIDFDDPHLRSIDRVQEYIALGIDQLIQGAFDSYYVSLQRLQELERSGTHSDRVHLQRKSVQAAFLKCYKNLAQDNGLLLRFDTCEKLTINETLWSNLRDTLFGLSNSCVLFSGRTMVDFYDSLSNTISGSDVEVLLHKIDLKGFSWDEAKEYIGRIEAGKAVNEESQRKIHLLTGGRPIMMDLAVDWWRRRIEIPELGRPLSDLKEEIGPDLIARFESALVRKLTTFEENVYRPILYMALIDRSGFTIETLHRLRRSGTSEESETLFSDLREFSFVKERPDGTIMLHDEMRRLVQGYVWELVDPQGTVRERILQEVIDHLEEQLDAVTRSSRRADSDYARERENIQLDILYYRTRLDYENGLLYFRRLFEQYIILGLVSFCETLVREFSKMAGSSWPTSEQNIVWARILYRRNEIIEARRLCKEALDDADLSPIAQVNALAVLSTMEGLNDALPHLEKAVSLAKDELKDPVITARMLFMVAQTYYNRGLWKTASSYYQKARETELSSKTPNIDHLASIENGLATVYNCQGQSTQAKMWCLAALKRRREQSNERLIALSLITLAEIYMNEGNGPQAFDNLREALQLLEKLHRESGLAVFLLDIALAHNAVGKLYLNVLIESENWTEDRAGREFEVACSIVESLQPANTRLLATTLMLRGHAACERANALRKERSLMLDELQYEAAKDYYHRALGIAQTNEMQDIVCEIVVGLANVAAVVGDYTSARQHFERATEIGMEEEYYLLLSKAERIAAEIDLRTGNLLGASRHFGMACKNLTQYTDYWFDRMLDEMIQTLQTLSNSDILKATNALCDFWAGEELTQSYPKLTELMYTLAEIHSV